MPRRPNPQRNRQLTEIVDAVRSGKLGWTIEDARSSGTEVDAIELHLGALDPTLRAHPNFGAASTLLRAGWSLASTREPRGARVLRAKGHMTRTTTRALVGACKAARLLGLDPPAPKSLETVAARHRRLGEGAVG